MYMFLLLNFIMVGCTRTSPEQTRLLVEEYPELYQEVFERDDQAIMEFTSSDSEGLRAQAWKSLISTDVENIDQLIELVIEANTDEAWASLWYKELNDEQVDQLEQLWESNPELREGLATVLGFHGDDETLDMLLNASKASDYDVRFATALAIGRLSMGAELTPDEELLILNKSLESTNSALIQAYLYGFYRSRKELNIATVEALKDSLENFYPDSPAGEQIISRILIANKNVDAALFRFELDEFETMDVQLAIELAQGISGYELTRHSVVVLNAMLDHVNHNVTLEALRAIGSRLDDLGSELDRAVLNKIGLIRGIQASLRLEALNSVTNPAKYKDLVYEIGKENAYTNPIRYDVLQKILSEDEFLDQLKSDTESEKRLDRFFALQELASWWGDLEEEAKSDSLANQVRSIVIENMSTADRSMIYMMSSLFRDEQLISASEFSLFGNMLSRFELPADVEVYQVISSVLKERFESEAKPLIDSLAAIGNGALNQTLLNQEWEIPEQETPQTEFREPDWKKLTRLGAYPILVLETNKGDFRIQFDVLNAPATISGMQSLIKQKAYERIPFHRVVPNFVIQGGDIETQDGFGGPDYVVPTEASSKQYKRAVVGIASAGTDTEGSQFFVMNQWHPHLNGRYTIIGEVVDGMEVVDRIIQGDYIEKIYWEL